MRATFARSRQAGTDRREAPDIMLSFMGEIIVFNLFNDFQGLRCLVSRSVVG